jgi:uncharacterized membrane protein
MSSTREQSSDDLDELEQLDDDTQDAMSARGVVVPRMFPWLLLVGGLIGFIASFDLLLERIHLMLDPNYVPSCNINPLLSCGSVMVTEQANAFGFSNPIIGVAAFPVVMTVGGAMLAGARLRPGFWWGLLAGMAFGVGFVHWLAFQTIFRIGALCPWCMVVWTVTLPLALYTFLHTASSGKLGLSERARRRVAAIGDYHVALLLGWYGIFVVVIALKFWDQWMAMFGLA